VDIWFEERDKDLGSSHVRLSQQVVAALRGRSMVCMVSCLSVAALAYNQDPELELSEALADLREGNVRSVVDLSIVRHKLE
jgi:hypothetical protein